MILTDAAPALSCKSQQTLSSYGLVRRNVLFASAAGVALIATGGLSAALAADAPSSALVTPPPDFQAVSAYLTGEAHLDAGLSARLYAGLLTADAQLPATLNALAQAISRHAGPPEALDAALTSADPKLVVAAKQILTAWTLGVTGTGVQARCLAFDDALSYRFVSDKTRPPSYAYGQYGTWSAQPVTVNH